MMVLPCVSSEFSCPAHRVCKRPLTQQTSPGRPLTGPKGPPAAGPGSRTPWPVARGGGRHGVQAATYDRRYPASAGGPGTGDGVANVVVTGGAGFVGSRLARELLAAGSLGAAGGAAAPLSRVTLIDRSPPPADLAADARMTAIPGDLGELLDPARAGWRALAEAD